MHSVRYEKRFNEEVKKAQQLTPRPSLPKAPSGSFAQLAKSSFSHPTYGILQPCLVPGTVLRQFLVFFCQSYFHIFCSWRHRNHPQSTSRPIHPFGLLFCSSFQTGQSGELCYQLWHGVSGPGDGFPSASRCQWFPQIEEICRLRATTSQQDSPAEGH